MDTRTDGHRENSRDTTNKVCGGKVYRGYKDEIKFLHGLKNILIQILLPVNS